MIIGIMGPRAAALRETKVPKGHLDAQTAYDCCVFFAPYQPCAG
jgi:hypothetical protein